MNSIKEISVVDNYAIVEPGIRIDDLNAVLAEKGYMFPVDPASSAVATVGGAINTGAGGMRGAKYGTMRDWVLGLTIGLADEEGTIMRIGCKTVKCRQGYDLVRLIVGSEGTLALVVDATLRITPLPENIVTILAFYSELEDLAESVVEIKSMGIQPYIMEFMDDRTVSLAIKYTGSDIQAKGHMLLVSVDVNHEASNRMLEALANAAGKKAAGLYKARSLKEAEEKRLFEIRRSLFLTQVSLAREFVGSNKGLAWLGDVAVPPSRLAEAVTEIRSLEEKYGLPTLIGGHIGDGNLHPAICFDPTNEEHNRKVEEWYHEVMRIALKLGGTISAEHGIGFVKKKGLRMELEMLGAAKALDIMRAIKRIFDPKGLLNPGKVV